MYYSLKEPPAFDYCRWMRVDNVYFLSGKPRATRVRWPGELTNFELAQVVKCLVQLMVDSLH